METLGVDDKLVFLVSSPQEATTLEEALSSVVMVSKGYVEDARNTDNAWLERMSLNLHASMDVFAVSHHLQGAQWRELNNELQVSTAEQDLLQKVANMRKAYYADQVREGWWA